eukprot:GSChrysophyteH2.ASY1.ANO1.1488.1 assembled CDS
MSPLCFLRRHLLHLTSFSAPCRAPLLPNPLPTTCAAFSCTAPSVNALNTHTLGLQLVLIGDTGVGKSCILLRFVDNTYTDSLLSSAGVDFRFRTLEVEKKACKLQIWDTAGQEKYRTITSAYYRGADGIVIIYDVTNKNSQRHVADWLVEVNRYSAEDACKLLIGNKCDLSSDRVVSTEEGSAFAGELGCLFAETSALSGDGVESAFLALTSALIARGMVRDSVSSVSGGGSSRRVSLQSGGSKGGKKPGNCC